MNEQKPIIVPEEIECSSGSVFSFNYKRVVYSLTMQPDKILIQQAISKSKTPAKGTSQIIMLNSLEEYQTWYSKLKLSYGKRITRRRLHYATTENGIIKYIQIILRLQTQACVNQKESSAYQKPLLPIEALILSR